MVLNIKRAYNQTEIERNNEFTDIITLEDLSKKKICML
jgi:hypothetical protein